MSVLEFRIGDVRDYPRVSLAAVRDADIVVNAAALKQVPTCEYFPSRRCSRTAWAPRTSCARSGRHGYPVETVVGISTDKACKPVNVMGMTKALQERIFVAANISMPRTRFICVRYGNVLASRGSVIPLFLEQIRNGGPVTITDAGDDAFPAEPGSGRRHRLRRDRERAPGETYVPRAPSARGRSTSRGR